MILSRKIRLKPTPEQKILFWKSAGVARWAFNFYLAENERIWREYLDNGKTGSKSISESVVRKYINNELKPTTHKWLCEVGSNVMKQEVKDADRAQKDYLGGLRGKPHFKSKHKSISSFYVNYESLSWRNHGFRGEKLGFVKTSEQLPRLPKGTHYINPRITFDGKYWYLSVGYEQQPVVSNNTDVSLGIDVGIKDLAICSNGSKYKNINKSKRVRQLNKKLKREQRKLSRKLESNTESYKIVKGYRHPVYAKPLQECKNIQKQRKSIASVYRKIRNINNNHIHQTTTEIVKTKPSHIVIETLNVKGMMKNKHLSKAIQEQRLHEVHRQLTYKCELYGIDLVRVPMFFPSSKMCSCCGNIKHNLKLKDRVYHCDACGLIIDRDFNASINLANYKPTQLSI